MFYQFKIIFTVRLFFGAITEATTLLAHALQPLRRLLKVAADVAKAAKVKHNVCESNMGEKKTLFS